MVLQRQRPKIQEQQRRRDNKRMTMLPLQLLLLISVGLLESPEATGAFICESQCHKDQNIMMSGHFSALPIGASPVQGLVNKKLPTKLTTALFAEKGRSGSAKQQKGNQVSRDPVSDEEALLACYAYLKRKHRLEWTEKEDRKKEQAELSSLRSTGYFWHDPGELKYLKKHQPYDGEDLEEREYDSDETLWKEHVDEGPQSPIIYDEDPSASEFNFTAYPFKPDEETLRRRRGAHKKWKDPRWKAMWYEKRWGGGKRRTKAMRKQLKIKERIDEIPDSVLFSPEMESLTEEEINDAIRTYVIANQRRSTSQKKTRRKRATEPFQLFLEKKSNEKMDLFTLMNMDENETAKYLESEQKKRSEKSRRAYQTRIKNAKQKVSKVKNDSRETSELPVGQTPRDAMLRIDFHIRNSSVPQIDDIKLMLRPKKLGRRKEVLRAILSQYFDLRGRCVPQNGETEFATQCTIDELGLFVIEKLEQLQLQETDGQPEFNPTERGE